MAVVPIESDSITPVHGEQEHDVHDDEGDTVQ